MSNIRKTFTKRELDMIEEMRKQIITLQELIESLDPGNIDIATTLKPGIVKIGNGLNISSDGLLSTVSSTEGVIFIPITLDSQEHTFTFNSEASAITALNKYIHGTANILFIDGDPDDTAAIVYSPIKVAAYGNLGSKMYTAAILETGIEYIGQVADL